jgi:hypothetical protein
MPVNAHRLPRPVDHRDGDRFPSHERNRRAWQPKGIGRWLAVAFLENECVCTARSVDAGLLVDEQTKRAPRRIGRPRRLVRSRPDVDTQHESGHLVLGMTGSAVAGAGRRVESDRT